MKCNDRDVFILWQLFTLPGSEIFQHNLAQNFDPVAPLLLVFFHSVWEKLWLLIASSHLRIEKGKRGTKEARGYVMTVSCHFPWNPKDSLYVPRESVPAWPGQIVLQSGRQKTPLGSQYPWVKIHPRSWIPLHQDGPWNGWEGAIQEVTVGQVSLGRTSSSTAPSSSEGQHPLLCEDTAAALMVCRHEHIHPGASPLTKIPLTNVSSGGSSKDKLGVFDNVLQQWDTEIT